MANFIVYDQLKSENEVLLTEPLKVVELRGLRGTFMKSLEFGLSSITFVGEDGHSIEDMDFIVPTQPEKTVKNKMNLFGALIKVYSPSGTAIGLKKYKHEFLRAYAYKGVIVLVSDIDFQVDNVVNFSLLPGLIL